MKDFLLKKEVVKLAREALADELFASVIYSRLAGLYAGESVKSKLIKISKMEGEHVSFWQEFLKGRGFDISNVKVNRLKLALYTIVFRLIGLGLTLRILEMGENKAIELYSRMLESEELDDYEKNKLRKILEDELVHEQEFAEEESKFEEFLEHVRDTILGMNDGLVEVLSVATGLAGVYGSPFHVALGGLIVGAAGALSMGIGALASVRAQRQIHEGVLQRISVASRYVGHVFKDRVVNYMIKKGYSKEISEAIAEESSKNHKLLSKVIAEEEYGIKEETLENPFRAGLYTGLAYAFGAFVPLVPYFIGIPISIAMLLSLIFAGAALAFTGFIIAISASLAVKKKVIEMILAGLGSAGVTFIIGRVLSMLFGVEVG